MSRENLNEAIHSIKTDIDDSNDGNQEFGKEIQRSSTFYTIFGKHDFLDDDGYPCVTEENELAFAKKNVFNDNESYFIKKHNGLCLDPVDSHEDKFKKGMMRMSDEKMFRFYKVSIKEFKHYLIFLKTKNSVYLRNAQREGF